MDLKESIEYITNNMDSSDKQYKDLYNSINYIKESIDEFILDESKVISKLYLDGLYKKAQEIISKGDILNKASSELNEILQLFDKSICENSSITFLNENSDYDFLRVSLVNDDICPECGIKMEHTKSEYKRKGKIKIVNSFVCQSCNRKMIMKNTFTNIVKNANPSDVNIIMEKDYTLPIRESNTLYFEDVIVLKNLKICSNLQHDTNDIQASVSIVNEQGRISKKLINVSYCKDCNKYYMLKSEFDEIKGIVLCKVIDETKKVKPTSGEFNMSISESKMHEYGYNVNINSQLPREQRQVILASLLESNIMTKSEILSHLDTLSSRGKKIPNWQEAVKKWNEDYIYVKEYDVGDLPQIKINKFILKYSTME